MWTTWSSKVIHITFNPDYQLKIAFMEGLKEEEKWKD